jgi:Leucine-rich repeat (LRR) protein
MTSPRLALVLLVASTLCLPAKATNHWHVYGCNPGTAEPSSNNPPASELKRCCMWTNTNEDNGEVVEGSIFRRGLCPDFNGTIALSSKSIIEIPIGTFENCGKPMELNLEDNDITSLTGVVFPDSLKLLDLDDNELSSLAGITFEFTHMENLYLGGQWSTVKISSLAGVTFAGTIDYLDLSYNEITSLSGITFSGTIKVLDLEHNNIKSIADASFPQSLGVLDLSDNDIKTLSRGTFPDTLTHLDLENNDIQSLDGVTITLTDCGDSKLCQYIDDQGYHKMFLDLSDNAKLTSLKGATFVGIQYLDLMNTVIDSLADVVLPSSIMKLDFENFPNWKEIICKSGITTEMENLHVCCVWFGDSYSGAPLSRIGTCPDGVYSEPLDMSHKGITSIPAHAFKDCGKLEGLKLNNNLLSSVAGLTFSPSPSSPTSPPLKALDLSENYITMLSGETFTTLSKLKILDLSNNRLTSLTGQEFPSSLTHLDLSNNHITSLRGAKFELSACSATACVITGYTTPTNERLDLSGNLISSLAGVKFLGSIKELHLEQNRIKVLAGVTFSDLLETLVLKDNMISLLAGVNFAKTQDLDLENNDLSSLDGVNFPESLTILNLQNNDLSSLAGVKFPDLLTHLFLDGNTLVVLDFEFDSVTNALLVLMSYPSNVCIPQKSLRDHVNDLSIGSCQWLVSKCNATVPKVHEIEMPLDPSGNPTDTHPDGSPVWPTNTHECCIWAGSYAGAPLNRTGACSLDGDVSIDLSDRHITAIPPGAFENIGSPGHLDLSDNKITSLAGVTFPASLTELDLALNKLTSLAGLNFNFTNMENLYLNGNEITSLAGVTFAGSIEELSLHQNKITTLAGVTFAGTIEKLWLDDNEITSLNGMTFPSSLELDLSGNKITSLAGVTLPSALEYLDLSFNKITSLAGVTFNFSHCHQQHPIQVTGLYCQLWLHDNEITSFDGAKFLGRMDHLNLGNLNGEYGITSLAGATFELVSLDDQVLYGIEIYGNTITSFAGTTFNCHTCYWLNFHDNTIASLAGVTFAGTIISIEMYDGNKITSLAGATFDCTDCDSLDLSGVEFTDSTPLAGTHFLGVIDELDLSENKITSLNGVKFAGQITDLQLHDNEITSINSVKFPSLLETLNLQHNALRPAGLIDVTLPHSLT